MEHRYRTSITWTGARKGVLSSPGKPEWPVACGPEFGGHEGYWTPEDIFVAAIEHCTMSTFLWLAERRRLPLVSYRSEAEGLATMSGGALRFTLVRVRARVGVPNAATVERVDRLFDEVRDYCLVLKSVTCEVVVEREVVVEPPG